MTLRAGLYGRQSRGSDKSITEQLDEMLADVAAEGWDVTRQYRDGTSASRYAKKRRPDWNQLLADVAAGVLDVVVLWESSRGDRTLTTWSAFLDTCRATGTRVRVTTHRRTYDLSIARDWRSLAEDGTDSAYESEKTRDRILRSVRTTVAAGKPHGRHLWGYVRRYGPNRELLTVDIDETVAPIIREMAKRFASGESAYAIAADLNARGITTPLGARWGLVQVRRILENPAYAGHRVHKGQIVGPAVWPAIIPADTWNVCVARFADPRRKTVRDTALRHLLSFTAVCDVCDSPMRWQMNGKTPSYVCDGSTGKDGRRWCVSIREDTLDGYVVDVLDAYLEREDVAELWAMPQEIGTNKSGAVARIGELRTELETGLNLVKMRKLSVAAYAAMEEAFTRQIGELEEHLRPVAVSPLVRGLVADFRGRWGQLNLGQRREVIASLLDIRVRKATVPGRTTFDPERIAVTPRSDFMTNQAWTKRDPLGVS